MIPRFAVVEYAASSLRLLRQLHPLRISLPTKDPPRSVENVDCRHQFRTGANFQSEAAAAAREISRGKSAARERGQSHYSSIGY